MAGVIVNVAALFERRGRQAAAYGRNVACDGVMANQSAMWRGGNNQRVAMTWHEALWPAAAAQRGVSMAA